MLLQSKKSAIILKEQVQVIHDHGDHWTVVSNMGCKPNVYDSVFSTVHKETQQVICNLFNAGSLVKVTMKPFQKQVGGIDCGVFAIAAVIALVFNVDPSAVRLNKRIATTLSYLL